MQQRFLSKTDAKRICAAFEEVIAESRRGQAKFPCDKYFHCGDDKKKICGTFARLGKDYSTFTATVQD